MYERLLKTSLANFKGTRILDIGPGFNRFAVNAAREIAAKDIFYIDVDEKVLEFQDLSAKEARIAATLMNKPLSVDVVQALDGSFDLILCQEILEHLINAEEILAALVHKLSPGGRMIITVPTAASERWMKILNPDYMKDEPFGHVRLFSAEQLKQMIVTSGLLIKTFQGIQPQYFLSHTWMSLTRMKVQLATGDLDTSGWKGKIFSGILVLFGLVFNKTFPKFWGSLLPRNFFVLAERRS